MNWSLFLDQSRYHDWIVVRVDQCISHYRPLYPTIAYYSLLYLSIYLYIYMCVYIYIYISLGEKKNYIPLYHYLSAMTSNIKKTGPRPSPAAATACSTSSVALSACGAPGGSSRARSRNAGRQDPGTRDDIFEYNWVYKWWISIHICSYIYI